MLSYIVRQRNFEHWAGLMSCKAALASATLALGVCAIAPEAGWSETISILSHGGGDCCSISAPLDPQQDPAPTDKAETVVSRAADDAADRPGPSNHAGGDGDSLAASSAADATALASGAESGGGAPAAIGSTIADPDPSLLTRLFMVLDDLRAQIFGTP
jgi:hypothetical protein